MRQAFRGTSQIWRDNLRREMVGVVTAMLVLMAVVGISVLCESARAGDMVDVNNVKYKMTRITMGPVTVDCVTGNVAIKEGVKLDAASKGFWQAVEDEFKRNAKIGMRIKAWEEIRTEPKVDASVSHVVRGGVTYCENDNCPTCNQ